MTSKILQCLLFSVNLGNLQLKYRCWLKGRRNGISMNIIKLGALAKANAGGRAAHGAFVEKKYATGYIRVMAKLLDLWFQCN